MIENISKIISLQNAPGSFCLDDSNLTKSLNMSNLKHQMTKCVNLTMQNLTKNILDQKSSNLCVPISVAALLRYAIRNDLNFVEKEDSLGRLFFSFEQILTKLLVSSSMCGHQLLLLPSCSMTSEPCPTNFSMCHAAAAASFGQETPIAILVREWIATRKTFSTLGYRLNGPEAERRTPPGRLRNRASKAGTARSQVHKGVSRSPSWDAWAPL